MNEGRTRLLFADHTPIVGGGQLVLVEHVRALDKNRFDVHVACTNAIPQLVTAFTEAGTTVHITEMPRLRGFQPRALARLGRAASGMRDLVRSAGIDLVVANTTRSSYVASLALIGTATPLIWWVRDFAYPKFLFRALRWIPRRIIYVSEALQSYYDGRARADSLVWPVASALHAELGQIDANEVLELRASYGFGPDEIVVGCMGRLVAEKGPEDVVEAVASLRVEFPSLRLLFVGTGRDQPNDVEERLHELVNRLRLGGIIRFAGYQTRQALFYSAFDVFVIATRNYEAYPTSAVQAMMAGIPVIASAVGGIPEVVHHERSGLLFSPGNPDDLAASLRRLLSDADFSRRLGIAGRDQVMANNGEESLARKAEELYISLTSGTAARILPS